MWIWKPRSLLWTTLAVILAPRALSMCHLCFADGKGPALNPTFGGIFFRGRLRFPLKLHSRVRTRFTLPADSFLGSWVDLEKKNSPKVEFYVKPRLIALSMVTTIKGGHEFSEGTSAKWILHLESWILFHVEKAEIMLYSDGKFLIDCLRPTFYNFIFTFTELIFHDLA